MYPIYVNTQLELCTSELLQARKRYETDSAARRGLIEQLSQVDDLKLQLQRMKVANKVGHRSEAAAAEDEGRQ